MEFDREGRGDTQGIQSRRRASCQEKQHRAVHFFGQFTICSTFNPHPPAQSVIFLILFFKTNNSRVKELQIGITFVFCVLENSTSMPLWK